ncbi:MAG: hypothetical protein U9R74_14195 [Pseudomonadota bacterium]|nr:hypothetical protein [Pseudomonadota bacterium]
MDDASPGYTNLHCLSNFSLLRGASHPEKPVEPLGRGGHSARALATPLSEFRTIHRGWQPWEPDQMGDFNRAVRHGESVEVDSGFDRVAAEATRLI